MSSALCRRQFLSRAFILGGAVLLLPSHRVSAAVTRAAGSAPSRATAEDTARRAVLALASRYGEIAGIHSSRTKTRLTVRIRCFPSMAAALGGARTHGITHIQAAGNVTAFELGGHQFELENLHASA